MADESTDADEFAHLTPASSAKSPILAMVVVVLAAVVGWHLRHDLRFALASKSPVDLGDARSLAARGVVLEDNTYVTLGGQPEHRYGLFVEPHGASAREELFRLLGAGSRLFVRAESTSNRVELDEKWTGRLRRFDEVGYAQSLRDYYAKETEVTHYLALDSLKAALSGGAGGLVDRQGAPIEVPADAPLTVDIAHPGQLQVWLSKDKYPTVADARHELERLQLAPSEGKDETAEFSFVIPMPEAKKTAIIDALTNADFAFQPYRQRVDVTRRELKLDGDNLVAGKVTAPWADVEAVGLPTPVVIGDDAFILAEGEAPGSYWWAPVVVGLLAAFALFNLWYLLRSLRRTA